MFLKNKEAMTRQELTDILDYCQSNGISISSRARELGIPPSTVFSARNRYRKAPDAVQSSEDMTGTFLPLQPDTQLGLQAGSVLGEAASRQAAEGGRGETPYCITMDVRRPDGTGIHITGTMGRTTATDLLSTACHV